jgi:hypothetical protein
MSNWAACFMKKKKKPSPDSVSVTPPPSPTREEIAKRAEALWRQRGCPENRDDQLWLEAERQLNGGLTESPPTDQELDTGEVAKELDERFPGDSGKETTSL